MYIGIPNENKKIILARTTGVETTETTAATLDDASANWRCLFRDILKTTPATATSSLTGLALSSNLDIDTAAANTVVNPNVSLLMTQQVEDLNTKNNFTPVVKSIEDKFKDIQSSTSKEAGQSGLLSKGWDAANFLAEVGSQFYNQFFHDGENSNAASNRNLMPWFTNVKAWDKESANVTFRYTFKFAMGQYGLWNAREEVFLPILNLMAPTLIRHLDSLTTTGPYPTAAAMIVKAFDGKSDEEEVDKKENSDLYDTGMGVLEKLILNSYKGFSYSIAFGNFIKFNKVIIENSDYSFSSETDQYGYPISGSVTLTFSSIVPVSLTANSEQTMALRLGV